MTAKTCYCEKEWEVFYGTEGVHLYIQASVNVSVITHYLPHISHTSQFFHTAVLLSLLYYCSAVPCHCACMAGFIVKTRLGLAQNVRLANRNRGFMLVLFVFSC